MGASLKNWIELAIYERMEVHMNAHLLITDIQRVMVKSNRTGTIFLLTCSVLASTLFLRNCEGVIKNLKSSFLIAVPKG